MVATITGLLVKPLRLPRREKHPRRYGVIFGPRGDVLARVELDANDDG